MNFDTLLGQLETTRPDLSDSLALIRQFQKTKNENNNDADSDDEVNRSRGLETLFEKQKNINKNLLQNYEQLKQNYQSLLNQLDDIAEAIGACPHCWGEEPNCNYCRGRGIPGYFQPDQAQFDTYIKPVIQKLKNNKSQSLNN